MIIFNEYNAPIIIDNINAPIKTDKMWVLNLDMPQPDDCKSNSAEIDFTLAPLLAFEETTGPSLVLNICGHNFPLPTSWHVLVYDQETAQLDVVKVEDLCGREFTAFVYGPYKSANEPGVIRIVDYIPSCKNVSPQLNKNLMLCHAIGPDIWIVAGPSDTYTKYLKDKVLGDII